jgi:hypothetical protein
MAKTASPTRFKAKLLRPAEGGDWTFLRLPQAASDQMPARSMVSVEGTINGFAFAATLQPDSEGGHWLRVEPAWSEAAKVRPGEDVELEISPVKVEPEPCVPDDLRQALAGAPRALAVWNDTTAIARRDWITWMGQVKRAETRLLRIEKMIDMLSAGKRRVCCFDRSGLASKAFTCPVAAEE